MTTRISRPAGLAALGAALALTACAVTPAQLGQLAGQLPGVPPLPGASASPATSGTSTPAPGGSAAPAGPGAEKEPNDDFPQATAIAVGAVISGEAKADDPKGDFYAVTLPAGAQAGWVTATLTKNSDDWAPNMAFYQADKTWLHEKGAAGGTQDKIVAAFPGKPGNTYYVKLSPSSSTSAYKLKVEFDPVMDMNEPNDDFPQAKPLTLGTAVAFALFHGADAPDDVDFFTFEAPAAATNLVVDLKNKSTSDDPTSYTVTILDASKNFVDEASSGNQADITAAELTIPSGGKYYVKITGPRNEALSELTITAK